MEDYVVFKNNVTLDNRIIFKKDKKYNILDEIGDKYAISYMDKKHPTRCCLILKDWEWMKVFS